MGDEGRGSDGSPALYVGHSLPESITKDHILQHFKAFVPHINVLKSSVITNKAGKRHCKLVFTSDAVADKAMSQMNRTQIRGFKLHVNRWGPKKKEPETDPLRQFLEAAKPQHVIADDSSSDDSQSDISSASMGSSLVCESEGSFRAYVGSNLPARIQESTLNQHFQSLGYTVKYARIITTKKKQTRFAIVAFSSQEALDEAVKQVHGKKLHGYKLTVSPKSKRKGFPHEQGQGQISKKQGKKPSAVGDSSTDPCTVNLRGIPSTVDSSLLQLMCEAHGKVTNLQMNKDGTAVVTYPSPELAATAATHLNGLPCGGGTLSVVSSANSEPLYAGYPPPQGHGPPLQGHGPPLQGHGPPLQGHGPPLHGHGPPLQGHGPPLHGHKPPLQSHEPTMQYHGPPLQGYGPPLQGHGPPLQGHGPPLHGHGPPLQRYGPPLQGHRPPLQGHRPPLQGHGPPLQGHGPPLHGHGPPVQRYGPPLQGHGPPPQSYGQGPAQPGLQFPQPFPPGGAYLPPAQCHMQPPLRDSQGLPQQSGQQLHPAGFCSGSSMQVHDHSGMASVKVSNIHLSVSEEDLKRIVSVVPSAVVLFHATPGSKPNYAYINCADQADASRVMDILKGKKFNGMPVSVKFQKGKEFSISVPPSPTVCAAPPVDMQVHDHSEIVSVKVSNIHLSISEEELKRIISVVPSAVVLFHATPGSKPNYAHINCADQADASRVMDILKGKKFNGMPVSVKFQKGKEFTVPPSPAVCAAPPIDMQTPVSVKVTRLPRSATEKQIRRHINSIEGISSVVLKIIPTQEHSYAYVNCENGFAAQQVVQKLNGMQLLGSNIKATVQQSKKAKENEEATASEVDTTEEGQEMSQDLYDFFQHRFSKDIANFEARGGTLPYSEGFITVRGPEAEVNAFYKSCLEPVKDGSQPLTADQWGQLMAAKKGGTTLFQELSSPFLHNPNVKLDRRENPFTLVIVGFQEAVDAARSHFFSKMDTKMVVDRMELFALAHLKPDLPDIIEAECAVHVSGFHPGSSELALDSDGGDLTRARMRLLGELDTVFVHKKRLTLKSTLVCSAQRFVESRKAQVVMCIREHGSLVLASTKPASTCTDEQLQVTLCGKPRETVAYIYRSLCAKPCCDTVKMSISQFTALDASAENGTEWLQQEYGIVLSYNPDEGQVAIQGFNDSDVKAASRILNNSKQTACKTQVLDCSKVEATYLNYVLFKNPTEQGEELLTALQADCSTTVKGRNNKILLVGPASSLDAATKMIKECSLLKGLQKKTFHYNWCNSVLLTDLKSRIHSLEESHEVVIVMSSRQEEDKRASSVDITLLGNNAESFEAVCQELQGIKPTSKKRDLEPAEVRQIKGEFLQKLESAYSVHIHVNHQKKLLVVQSLWPTAISHTFSEMNDLFCDTVRVHKKVPVSVAQLRFLREKRTSELDDDAHQVSMGYPEAHILSHKEANDLVYINVSGLRRFVESAAESINEMLNGFECKEEVMDVDSRYQWTREWQQATKLAIEAECDVVVEFPPHASPSSPEGKGGGKHSEKYTIAIQFSFVHENAHQQAKDIVAECITLSTHIVEVDRAQQGEILKALKDRKLSCMGTLTSVKLKMADGVVHIISPQRFPNGVEEMEERLMQYIRKEVSSSDEVCLEPPLSVLIQNRHFKDLKKNRSVFFKFTPCAVSLSGKMADVEAAKGRLKILLSQLESNMCTQMVTVPKWLQFAINTKEVRSVLCRFEKSHCVHITIPKDTGTQNELKWEAKLHPEGWSVPCAVQLVHGTLTKEDTDAIVNAANENLELMGGLAGSILKAGGSEIQEECTKYIALNGQVNVGDAVCLGSGKLPCKKVIHAVGPRWQGGGSGEDRELEATFLRSLEVAVQNGCLSIALPAISTGVFHVPVQRCAWSAVNALTYFVSVHPDKLSTVKFVLFREADVPPFQEAFQSLLSDQSFKTNLMQSSLTSSMAGVKSEPVWMWEDNAGVYQSFTSSLSAQLEQQFAISPSGLFQLQRDQWSYTMNLGAMTQTNKKTGKVRRLRRDAHLLSSQWYWEDDSGHMQPYKPAESTAIESIHQRHGAGNSLTINGQNYMFDFDKKVQVNSTTGHRRRIEYRAGQQPPATALAASRELMSAPSQALLNPSEAESASVTITVRGCEKDVNAAVAQIEDHMKGMCGSEVLQFPKKFAQKMERCLEDVSARFHVQVRFKDADLGSRAADLTGWKVSISKVIEEGRKTLIELMQAGITEEVSRPPEWEGDDSSSSLSLKDVKPSSNEFGKVLSLMQRTLPNVRIIKLERIQNEWLWTRYSQHRELIKKKNQGTAQELDLFHGTRNNPPNFIYTGEEGFDMRFSAQGMWGTGNYFAVNASYSHAYAHSMAGGQHQMFLVKVVVGASFDCPSNPSLRMPPEKQSKTTSMFGVERYDSVSGVTGGSKVYIIYDNLKAYPFYLITYTV